MQNKEIFTLANLISLFRLFLAVPIFYFISQLENNTALALIVLGMITDSLDGYFARKWNQITTLGKIIDPLADKACIIGSFIALSLYQDLPYWITIIIIVRDILIIIGSIFIIGFKNLVIPSNVPGKITVFVISLLGIIYLMNITFLKTPFIILSAIAILVSLVNYTITFYKNMTRNNESGIE